MSQRRGFLRSARGTKIVRVRDPIHNLIVFNAKSDIDQLAWQLINSVEFQRLRRIRQLGFSEYTYPGATHTSFSHSIGVFHVARILVKIIEQKFRKTNEDRRIACLCAALLHDIGHGPFSHVFERINESYSHAGSIESPYKHEYWSGEIILGNTEVNEILRRYDQRLPEKIVRIINSQDPEDIFASIISSQFDADRLDYLRRDRYMCGVSVGHFDYDWLLENLMEADVVRYSDPTRQAAERIKWLVLHPKAREAAEGYLLARYQLYSTVYYHKATRSAEGMLRILLKRAGEFAREKKFNRIGVEKQHPILIYLGKKKPELDDYMRLDDYSIWSLLSSLAFSRDRLLSEIARRILERKLFKSFDVGVRVDSHTDTGETFLYELKEELPKFQLVEDESFFEDRPQAKGYDWYEWDAPSALKKVLVRDIERNRNIDIGSSDVVSALKARRFLRIYATDSAAIRRIERFWIRQGGGR